jgi:hypothetical protein
MLTRTKINGKWVNDPIKDYSNGKAKQPNQVAKLQAQLNHLATLVKGIDDCTRMVDAKELIRRARASYPR